MSIGLRNVLMELYVYAGERTFRASGPVLTILTVTLILYFEVIWTPFTSTEICGFELIEAKKEDT